MTDTLLHIVLGTIYGLLTVTLVLSLPVGPAVGVSGALFIYLREVTQRQTSHGLSFERGWNPLGWRDKTGNLNVQKVVETIVPVVVLIAAGAGWDIWNGT